MMKSWRRALPHWMVRRSLPDSSNSMRALVRASMVSLKSISEGLTPSGIRGLICALPMALGLWGWSMLPFAGQGLPSPV